MRPFEYQVPGTLDAALQAHKQGDVLLKASGVDVLDLVKEGILSPDKVLSLHKLDKLAYVEQDGTGLRIGALTTLADLGRNEMLRRSYLALAEAAATTATPQVRERATLGGNLCQRPRCWYFRSADFNCWKKSGTVCYAVNGDNQYHAILGGGPCHIVHPSNCAPALLALDARLVVRKAGGERVVPAREFFSSPAQSRDAENVLQPGEVLIEVRLPKAPSSSATIELREKPSFDWPVAMASVARIDGRWRICLGAVAPVPWLSEEAAAVVGSAESVDEELAARAGETAVRGAVPLSENAYKVQLARVAVKRALLAAGGREVPR